MTFLVGENGSENRRCWKDWRLVREQSQPAAGQVDQDETLWAAHEFAKSFRFVRRNRPKRTMFMRAEDILGYTLTAARQRKEAAIAFAGGVKALEAAREAEERDEAADIAKPSIARSCGRV